MWLDPNHLGFESSNATGHQESLDTESPLKHPLIIDANGRIWVLWLIFLQATSWSMRWVFRSCGLGQLSKCLIWCKNCTWIDQGCKMSFRAANQVASYSWAEVVKAREGDVQEYLWWLHQVWQNTVAIQDLRTHLSISDLSSMDRIVAPDSSTRIFHTLHAQRSARMRTGSKPHGLSRSIRCSAWSKPSHSSRSHWVLLGKSPWVLVGDWKWRYVPWCTHLTVILCRFTSFYVVLCHLNWDTGDKPIETIGFSWGLPPTVSDICQGSGSQTQQCLRKGVGREHDELGTGAVAVGSRLKPHSLFWCFCSPWDRSAWPWSWS